MSESLNTTNFSKLEKLFYKLIKKFEKKIVNAIPTKGNEGGTMSIDHIAAPQNPERPLKNKSEFKLKIEIIHDAKAFQEDLTKFVEECEQECEELEEKREKATREILESRKKCIEKQGITEHDLYRAELESAVLGCDGELLSAKIVGKDGKIIRLAKNDEGLIRPIYIGERKKEDTPC